MKKVARVVRVTTTAATPVFVDRGGTRRESSEGGSEDRQRGDRMRMCHEGESEDQLPRTINTPDDPLALSPDAKIR